VLTIDLLNLSLHEYLRRLDQRQHLIGRLQLQVKSKPVSNPSAHSNVETSAAAPAPAVDAVEIDKVAEYNGQPLFNLDLESMEEKPWRKPGMNLSK
jgi:Fip1 motif